MSASVDRILSLITSPAAQAATEATVAAASPAAKQTMVALLRADRLSRELTAPTPPPKPKEAQAPRILPPELRGNTSGDKAHDAFLDWQRSGETIHSEGIDPSGRLEQTSDHQMPIGGRRGNAQAETTPPSPAQTWTREEAEKYAGVIGDALLRAGVGGVIGGLGKNVYNKQVGQDPKRSMASAAALGAMAGAFGVPAVRAATAPIRWYRAMGKTPLRMG